MNLLSAGLTPTGTAADGAVPSAAAAADGGAIQQGVVLLALDKFKGTLAASEACCHLAAGLRRGNRALVTRSVPVADGGDGSVAAAVRAGFIPRRVRATGPQGKPVEAMIAVSGSCAVIEVAEVCGLRRAGTGELAPLTATTYGVGELIRAALGIECETIVVALGGSATIDGGTGMLTALGARFSDDRGRLLSPGGGPLAELAEVDLEGLDPRIRDIQLILATDVDNPLVGPDGAAHVYGPQKGADTRQVRQLEAGLRRLLAHLPGREAALADRAGAGAAGGLGFAGLLLGGEIHPGAEFFLDLLGFDQLLPGASLVITGEGRLDRQTLHGKAPARVADRSRRSGVPVIAVAGSCTLSREELHAVGIRRAVSLLDIDPRCVTDPELTAHLLEHVGQQLTTTSDIPALAMPAPPTPHGQGQPS
jgi:glycerate 2-kinase